MDTNVLHDEEGFTTCSGDSGIDFENACGAENFIARQIGEVTEIALGDRGIKDASCITTFYDQIVELVQLNHCRVLILDMHGVWFLPSKTLGALLALRRIVERVELHNVSDEVREVLRVTQLDQMFHVDMGCPVAS